MNQILIVLLIIFSSTAPALGNQQDIQRSTSGPSEVTQTSQENSDYLKQRFTKYSDFLSGNAWALIHTSGSPNEVKQSLDLIKSIGVAVAGSDPAALKSFDGPAGFKNQLLKLMKSDDDAVAAFAVGLLAVIGDLNYASQIADLLGKKGDRTSDDHPVTIRGRAATALGLLGARQYTERIVPLLWSKNDYDRSGAAMALGYLKATEHAEEVVDLLLSPELRADDVTPIHALIEMGVAANYKKEIAQGLADMSSERSKAAAYALAHLRAREFAGDIAKLLDAKYKKGDAAKALALMGAKEYSKQIALMLNDDGPLDRMDAAFALGILGAKQYAPAVARLLNDKADFVRFYAAVSLVLMEAKGYATRVVPLIDKAQKSGVHINPGDFHELVKEEGIEVNTRFKRGFAKMKGAMK